MTENEEHALTVFLQSLAVSIWNFFEGLPLEDKQRADFLRVFDGYLGETLAQAESEGLNVSEGVRNLRGALDKALNQMQLLKTDDGSMH